MERPRESRVSCWFYWERQLSSRMRFNGRSSTIRRTRDWRLWSHWLHAKAFFLGETLIEASLAGAPKRARDFRSSSYTATPVMRFIAATSSPACERRELIHRSTFLNIPATVPGKATPTENSLVAAALEAIDLLPRRIVLLGESLGSAVACQAAARRRESVAGLVLLTPFDSLITVARKHYPVVPSGLILKDRYESSRALQEFHGPVVCDHGGARHDCSGGVHTKTLRILLGTEETLATVHDPGTTKFFGIFPMPNCARPSNSPAVSSPRALRCRLHMKSPLWQL